MCFQKSEYKKISGFGEKWTLSCFEVTSGAPKHKVPFQFQLHQFVFHSESALGASKILWAFSFK